MSGFEQQRVGGSMVGIACLRVARSIRSARRLPGWLTVLILVAAMLSVAPAAIQPATAATAVTFTISSTTGWQQSPINVTSGEVYALTYLSGSWTVDYRNFPQVGPGGYSDQVDSQIYQGCKYLASSNYAVLLGAVGNGSAFAIGNGGTFTAQASGPLLLRINDDDACLGDNAGSVTMQLETQPAPITTYGSYAGYSAGPLAGTDRYALADWKVPKVKCSRAPGRDYTGRAAVWVGLWGSSKWLMQAGTNSLCSKHSNGNVTYFTTIYYAWFELVPENPHPLKMTVHAGDTIYAQVEYKGDDHGQLRFWYDVTDNTSRTQKNGFVDTSKGVSLDSFDQGGAIVEGLPVQGSDEHLAKFDPITISHVGVGAGFSLLPTVTRYLMGQHTCVVIVCTDDLLAQTGALSNGSFTVTWQKYAL